MAGVIVYEDDDCILVNFSGLTHVDVRLLLKREYRALLIRSDDFSGGQVVVHAIATEDVHGNKVHVKKELTATEFLKLRNELGSIKTPREFILAFLRIISPSMTRYVEVVKG